MASQTAPGRMASPRKGLRHAGRLSEASGQNAPTVDFHVRFSPSRQPAALHHGSRSLRSAPLTALHSFAGHPAMNSYLGQVPGTSRQWRLKSNRSHGLDFLTSSNKIGRNRIRGTAPSITGHFSRIRARICDKSQPVDRSMML